MFDKSAIKSNRQEILENIPQHVIICADYKMAIKCGATMVRIGSCLFG